MSTNLQVCYNSSIELSPPLAQYYNRSDPIRRADTPLINNNNINYE